tara:strand:+ start:33724 stop:34155 length:432 start_codon:yes stop_codon:yes gene_type:complete
MKRDEIVMFSIYAKVKEVGSCNSIVAEDLNSETDYTLSGEGTIRALISADSFSKEEKVTMTSLAEKLSQAGNDPFTVVFKKKDGTERTMRGVISSTENILGRCRVIDLDKRRDETKDYDARLRQVDYRTIQSLVINGVKFVLK